MSCELVLPLIRYYSAFIKKLLNLTKAKHHCWCKRLIDNTSQAVDNMIGRMQRMPFLIKLTNVCLYSQNA
jgi:hypothetical protein